MDELKFKFTYNGENSFANLMDYLRFNTSVDKSGRYWKGVVKINEKNFLKVDGKYFIAILFKIIWELNDKKNIIVEMNLYSSPLI